jgi:diguanylate cyclase (GGDEF)-like protein/PAS domain S-box-containing protein
MKDNVSILYVEDENNVREMLGHFISRFCKNLYVAQDGEEGLELYMKHEIDIVISDIKMPKMNGIDMVAEMKKINPKQLVIFTTAHIDSEYLFKAIELQVDGYISKPVDLDKLKIQIDKCHIELAATDAIKKLRESEERFRVILDTAQLGIFIYKEKFIYVNDFLCDMLGYTREELYKMDAWAFICEEERETVKEVILRRLSGEKFPNTYSEAHVIAKDGSSKVHRVTTATIEYEGGYAGLGTSLDLTDILATKTRLQFLAQAMEQMDEMVRITDKDGFIIYANDALTKHTGYRKTELIGSKNIIFKSGQQEKSFVKKLYENIMNKKVFNGVFINKTKHGKIYYEEQTITPILDDYDEIKYFVSTSQDITQRIALEAQLKKLATIDALTNIYNRYKINEEIEEEFVRVNRYDEPFSLVMFDIDFFKKVNDTYGHDAGDEVLRTLSRIIKENIRETDKFGRWGGEEFMLLAPYCEKEEACRLAEKLRSSVEAYKFEDMGTITVSIGVSTYQEKDTKETILKRVDTALYEAKESGRNRVNFL